MSAAIKPSGLSRHASRSSRHRDMAAVSTVILVSNLHCSRYAPVIVRIFLTNDLFSCVTTIESVVNSLRPCPSAVEVRFVFEIFQGLT